MNARVSIVFIAFASILTASGCKKSDDKATNEAKPAEKAAGCSDKALKHTNPSFCFDVPAGYAASPEKKGGAGTTSISVARASDKESFTLSWGMTGLTVDSAIRQIKKPATDSEKIVEQGDLPGGGYFTRTVTNDATTSNKDYFTAHVVAKGTKGFVDCDGESSKADFVAEVLKACKALRVD